MVTDVLSSGPAHRPAGGVEAGKPTASVDRALGNGDLSARE
ncbi:hypothetical protein OG943_00735 [Amycolatopsis sp. NBC_00345]